MAAANARLVRARARSQGGVSPALVAGRAASRRAAGRGRRPPRRTGAGRRRRPMGRPGSLVGTSAATSNPTVHAPSRTPHQRTGSRALRPGGLRRSVRPPRLTPPAGGAEDRDQRPRWLRRAPPWPRRWRRPESRDGEVADGQRPGTQIVIHLEVTDQGEHRRQGDPAEGQQGTCPRSRHASACRRRAPEADPGPPPTSIPGSPP